MALTESEIADKAQIVSEIEAIDKAILGIITSGKSSLSINGRSVTNMSVSDLESHRRSKKSELKKLERKERGINTSSIRCYG